MFTRSQREKLPQLFLDLAKLTFAGLVSGGFLQKTAPQAMFAGFLGATLFVITGIHFAKEEN
ncbi:hypothetical protein FVE67_05150 [Thermosulfurimonas marina]|uniref:Uncharacterized protein n=1 Tax=Thermosulfurimonas marina TaxID=2047767 RepID=A0A6H1WSU5_9BACT|nr:hypothetical protein [Thermosulfurimonas marina]QJA06224.1 hypothetical protein FVE67_05150 [Thermosulfurimonas marina]